LCESPRGSEKKINCCLSSEVKLTSISGRLESE
jgi:hypothetical protein